ncbi:MAG: hypothetical protein EXQ58_09375 [Acidobacteria bacterium]|nr:hypothetical protein [Acidobacteriota bacterium]
MTALWKYRKFILQNAVNDLRHRHAGATMGVFGNVLNPLVRRWIVSDVIWSREHRKQPAMPEMAAIRSPTANSGPSQKALRCRLMTKTMLSVRQERPQPACLATGLCYWLSTISCFLSRGIAPGTAMTNRK